MHALIYPNLVSCNKKDTKSSQIYNKFCFLELIFYKYINKGALLLPMGALNQEFIKLIHKNSLSEMRTISNIILHHEGTLFPTGDAIMGQSSKISNYIHS